MRMGRKASAAALVAASSSLVVLATLIAAAPSEATQSANPRHQISAVPGWTRSAPRTGAPTASSQHDLLVMLAGRDPGGLTALARSVNEPGSADYHHFLTPAQYAARFAPTRSVAKTVTSWLTSQGLTVTGRDRQNAYLQVRGTAKRIDAAFGTTLGTFRRDGRTVMAPAAPVSVPSSLSGQVAGIVGLNTAPLPTTQHVSLDPALSTQTLQKSLQQQEAVTKATTTTSSARSTAKAAADTRSAGSSYPIGGQTLGCGQYYGDQVASDLPDAYDSATTTTPPAYLCGYTPSQIRQAFGISKSGDTGKGVTVGITMWCDPDAIASGLGDQPFTADLAQWAKLVGAQPWKTGQYTMLTPAGGYDPTLCPDANARVEQALDVETIHAVAPDASIIVSSASAPTDTALIAALHVLVDTRQADVISDSWSELEASEDSSTLAAYDQVFEQADAEGISVLFGSGDDGDNTGISGSPQPSYPASDPWITSVGGTSDGISQSGKLLFTDPWFTTAKLEVENTFGPANDPNDNDYEFAGGGGTSADYAQPWYQAGVVPGTLAGSPAMRVYPDVSNLASPLTPFRLGLSDGGLLGDNFVLTGVGGTSLATPTTAAELADAIQQYRHPAGFINPVLYAARRDGLTDLSSNTPGHAFAMPVLGGLFGVEQYTDGAQSESMPVDANPDDTADYLEPVTTTLAVAPGYDNLSGLGAVTNFKLFAKAVDG